LLRPLIEAGHAHLSVRRQCELLGLSRSSLYYEPIPETAENLRLMRLLDQEYTAHPFLGSRRLTRWLIEQGEEVNRKRVQRLMRLMGLEAIYPKPKLSVPGRGHRIYPYLLRNVTIHRPDQVWSSDITYVPLAQGFMYLAAIIDWFSNSLRNMAALLSPSPCSRQHSRLVIPSDSYLVAVVRQLSQKQNRCRVVRSMPEKVQRNGRRPTCGANHAAPLEILGGVSVQDLKTSTSRRCLPERIRRRNRGDVPSRPLPCHNRTDNQSRRPQHG
jgi:HTH-like domain